MLTVRDFFRIVNFFGFFGYSNWVGMTMVKQRILEKIPEIVIGQILDNLKLISL